MSKGTGGSNPSLSANNQIFGEVPKLAVRGSPAKGVGWGDWREGSNPSFSAKKLAFAGFFDVVVSIIFLDVP